MNLINEVLYKFLFKGVRVYLDDMLIYLRDYQEHVKLVHEVLKTLYQNKLFAKLSKYEFHMKELDFLGYRISGEGLKMDSGKVRDILQGAPPKNRRQL